MIRHLNVIPINKFNGYVQHHFSRSRDDLNDIFSFFQVKRLIYSSTAQRNFNCVTTPIAFQIVAAQQEPTIPKILCPHVIHCDWT